MLRTFFSFPALAVLSILSAGVVVALEEEYPGAGQPRLYDYDVDLVAPLIFERRGLAGATFSPGQQAKVKIYFSDGVRPHFSFYALALVRGGDAEKMYKALEPDDMEWRNGYVTMWVTLPTGDDIVDGDDYELWAQQQDASPTHSPRFSIRN